MLRRGAAAKRRVSRIDGLNGVAGGQREGQDQASDAVDEGRGPEDGPGAGVAEFDRAGRDAALRGDGGGQGEAGSVDALGESRGGRGLGDALDEGRGAGGGEVRVAVVGGYDAVVAGGKSVGDVEDGLGRSVEADRAERRRAVHEGDGAGRRGEVRRLRR